MPATCQNTVDLSAPIARERVRDFQPPWRTVFVYRCTCGATHRVRASAYRGKVAEPSRGGIRCGATLAPTVPA